MTHAIEYFLLYIIYTNLLISSIFNSFMKSFNGVGEEIKLNRLEYYICFRIPLLFVLGARFIKSEDDDTIVFMYGNKHWKIKIID